MQMVKIYSAIKALNYIAFVCITSIFLIKIFQTDCQFISPNLGVYAKQKLFEEDASILTRHASQEEFLNKEKIALA